MNDSNKPARRAKGRSGSGGRGANSGRGANKKSQKRANKRRRKNSAKAARAFWGDPAKLPVDEGKVAIATNPSAVVESLGKPPLSGQETAAKHHFDAVYERAVFMAGALAAASDLVIDDENG